MKTGLRILVVLVLVLVLVASGGLVYLTTQFPDAGLEAFLKPVKRRVA
jgi:hypothetical protein